MVEGCRRGVVGAGQAHGWGNCRLVFDWSIETNVIRQPTRLADVDQLAELSRQEQAAIVFFCHVIVRAASTGLPRAHRRVLACEAAAFLELQLNDS